MCQRLDLVYWYIQSDRYARNSAYVRRVREVFSSAKILLNNRRSRLLPEIIEANECLRAWYGKPKNNAFDDETIGVDEGDDKVDGEAEIDVEIAIDAQGDGEVI